MAVSELPGNPTSVWTVKRNVTGIKKFFFSKNQNFHLMIMEKRSNILHKISLFVDKNK